MGEETSFVDAVPEYAKRSRLPTASRYRELIDFIRKIFSDGVITDQELATAESISNDITLEYMVAADIYDKLPSNDPKKAAANELYMHLHRCQVLMSFATGKAKEAHDSHQALNYHLFSDETIDTLLREHLEVVPLNVKPENNIAPDVYVPMIDQATIDLYKKQKQIKLKGLSIGQRFLMGELKTEEQRIHANIKEMRNKLSSLSPQERIECEALINAVLEHLERVNMEHFSFHEMTKLLGLERFLEQEKERVREA